MPLLLLVSLSFSLSCFPLSLIYSLFPFQLTWKLARLQTAEMPFPDQAHIIPSP